MSPSPSSVSLEKSSAPPPLPFQDPQLLPEPRRCRVGAGVVWLTAGLEIFKENIWLWLGMTLTMTVITLALSVIPVIGVLISIGNILFIGGIIKAAAAQERGEPLKFEYLFSAFQTHLKPLLMLMLLYIAGILAVSFIVFLCIILLATGDVLDTITIANGMSIRAMLAISLCALFVAIPILALGASLWFAPPLIVLHDLSPSEAMKQSLKASLRNWLPMSVMCVVFGVIGMLLTIFTLGIGIFLAMPIILLIYYTSYRDVWTDQPLSAV